MHPTKPLVFAAVALLLGLGCGDDDPGGPDTSPGDTGAARDSASDGGRDGEAGRDATLDSGVDELCDPTTGLRSPLPACTEEYPCVRTGAEVVGDRLTDPSPEPACDELGLARWEDTAGTYPRYACLGEPTGASPASRRPLVLYFHPGGEGGAHTLTSTQLIARHQSYDLSGDPARPGFVLAAIHGRNLHHPTVAARDGRHHDFYFRDLAYPSRNDDVAVIDRLVASLRDLIDPNRIYVMGWSNGAFFGQMYSIARHDASGAGFQVAAASVFAAGSPFGGIEHDPFTDTDLLGVRCGLGSVPPSDVPIQLVYRTCDLPVPCGASQSACFGGEPGYETTTWLAESSGPLDITPMLISGLEAGGGAMNRDAAECYDFGGACPPPRSIACSTTPSDPDCLCFYNHKIWPDGVRDLDGTPFGADREADMLDFLRMHPLTP